LILVAPLEALLNAPVLPEGLDDLVEFLKTETIGQDFVALDVSL